METLDLLQLGGLPVTQDMLDILQNAYRGSISGMNSIYGGNTGLPLILYGMEENIVSASGTDTITVSDGWILYNDEIIKFTGTVRTQATGSSNVTLIEITGDTAVPLALPYYNTSTPPVYRNTVATNILGAGGSGFFIIRLSDFLKASQLLGESSRGPLFTTIPVNVTGVPGVNPTLTGNIKYRRDWLKGTVRIIADISVQDLAYVSGILVTNMTAGTLPAAYLPVRATYKAMLNTVPGITDGFGSRFVSLLACFDTTGDFKIDVNNTTGDVDYAIFIDEEFGLD